MSGAIKTIVKNTIVFIAKHFSLNQLKGKKFFSLSNMLLIGPKYYLQLLNIFYLYLVFVRNYQPNIINYVENQTMD